MNCWICLIPKSTLLYLKGLTALLFALSLPAHISAADFGVADWGMTPDQIKQLETRSNLTPFTENSYLIYEVNLRGIDRTRLVYQFQNGRLSEGRFIFYTANPVDFSRAASQYRQIVQMMSSQYGPPQLNQQIQRPSSAMTVDTLSIANELAADRLILKTQWRTDSAIMTHQLAWNSNRPHHQIHYLPVSSGSPPTIGSSF